ncbi:MAG: sugar transferase [Gemmatimonadota bacterium]
MVTSRSKRALDVIGAALGLVALAPLYALIAAAIRLDSPGPVHFRQERAGLYGRPFLMNKFRTMREGTSEARHREYVSGLVNGDREQGHEGVYKLTDDDRVTRVGRLLRRTSLDELPQLINVLRGEMSLVGPRPAIAYEVELYEDWQRARLDSRPGLTGLWQVSGRNRLTYRRMCELDVRYIREWSLKTDLLILLKTVPVVLTNSGAAH